MLREITATGTDIEDAKETARLLLGASENDKVTYEILDAGSKGVFGIIGVRPAKVKAVIEIPGEEQKSFDRSPRQNRPDNRRKPEMQKKPVESVLAVEETEEDDSAEEAKEDIPVTEGSAPAKKRRRRNRRNGRRDRIVIPEMPTTPAKPHEAMIPESELKMEKVEVGEGEDLSLDFIRKLIENIGIDATAELYACEDDTRRVIIAGEDASLFIGHHGDTLDALQYLANLASAKANINGEKKRQRVTIDVEGYRAKREETLRALARRMAAKALRNGRSVMLEPMTPYERRIIHSEVQNIDGVSTNSVGSDMNRKVVIYLVKDAGEATPTVDNTEDSDIDA